MRGGKTLLQNIEQIAQLFVELLKTQLIHCALILALSEFRQNSDKAWSS
jgi:hypothetical protein